MVNILSSLKNYLVSKLITSGIEVYVSENIEEAMSVIDKVSINVILMDINSKDVDFLDFIKKVREKEGFEKTRHIILSKAINKDILSKYIPHGLIGVLPKNLELEEYPKKIINYIDSHLLENERRKNVRVKPDKDNINVRLPIVGRSHDKVEGKVIDLSIQGVAFKFLNKEEKNYYMLNQELDNCEIDISGKRYITKMKLVRVSDISVAVYTKPKESFIKNIAKYIFENLEKVHKTKDK